RLFADLFLTLLMCVDERLKRPVATFLQLVQRRALRQFGEGVLDRSAGLLLLLSGKIRCYWDRTDEMRTDKKVGREETTGQVLPQCLILLAKLYTPPLLFAFRDGMFEWRDRPNRGLLHSFPRRATW